MNSNQSENEILFVVH